METFVATVILELTRRNVCVTYMHIWCYGRILLRNQCLCTLSTSWPHLSIQIQEKLRKFHFTGPEIWSVLFTWHVNPKPSVSWHTDYNIPHFTRAGEKGFFHPYWKKAEKYVVETGWVNKWPLHQENNGQSWLGDSWHTRRASGHLEALLSFHFSCCR
jgi:hypothetical protein